MCTKGANFIRNNRQLILDRYKLHATKMAQILGKQAQAVFLMEPDLFQYSNVDKTKQQGGGITGEYARKL